MVAEPFTHVIEHAGEALRSAPAWVFLEKRSSEQQELLSGRSFNFSSLGTECQRAKPHPPRE
jgi:hypothetical protein